MIADYYKDLTLKVVTRTSDNAGGYTESEVSSTIRGYLAPLSAYERLIHAQTSMMVVAKLFTESVITLTSRIVDGSDEYEVVGAYNFHHRYYELKKII